MIQGTCRFEDRTEMINEMIVKKKWKKRKRHAQKTDG